MEQRRFRILLSSLVALVALQVQAEAQQLPRLVVCITVDQLRSDYLEELAPLMQEHGLKQMMQEGRLYRDVRFPLYQPSVASTSATIHTGTYPHIHGIESGNIYLRGRGREQSILWDEAYQGDYTRDTYAPTALLVSSLGDRLKDASQGTSLVYSLAPDAEAAIVAAGVMGDGAYWIDNAIGAWSSTSYYPKMSAPLEQYNRSAEGPNKRLLAGLMWRPQGSYKTPEVSFSHRDKAFSYRYQGVEAVSRFKQSALVNEEVTNFALRVLEHAGYEHRRSPGLLALTYTAQPQGSGELEAEVVDTYLRLDADIKRLLSALDRKIGLRNCLIAITGTGYTTYQPYIPLRKGEATNPRRISVERLTALTNMYLTAAYGSGEWIESNRNGRLYLNRKLIESRKLSLSAVQRSVADFLRSAEGLSMACSLDELRGGSDLLSQQLSRSIHARYAADVYWSVLPGWEIEEASRHPQLRLTSLAVPTPLILWGPGVSREFDYPVVEATDIVRAICSVLRIRPPNA